MVLTMIYLGHMRVVKNKPKKSLENILCHGQIHVTRLDETMCDRDSRPSLSPHSPHSKLISPPSLLF